jgi:hypothetical protein
MPLGQRIRCIGPAELPTHQPPLVRHASAGNSGEKGLIRPATTPARGRLPPSSPCPTKLPSNASVTISWTTSGCALPDQWAHPCWEQLRRLSNGAATSDPRKGVPLAAMRRTCLRCIGALSRKRAERRGMGRNNGTLPVPSLGAGELAVGGRGKRRYLGQLVPHPRRSTKGSADPLGHAAAGRQTGRHTGLLRPCRALG